MSGHEKTREGCSGPGQVDKRVTKKTQIQTNNDCIYNNYIQCYNPNSPTRSTHITLPEHSSTNAHFLGCSAGRQAFRKSWPPTLHHVCNRPVLMRYRFSSRNMGTSDRKIGRWNQQVLVSPTGYFHWPSGRGRYFFHESFDHRGLRGAIPYTRCQCGAWDNVNESLLQG